MSDRLEQSRRSGTPEWPCPYCGHDEWAVYQSMDRSERKHPRFWPATCTRCHVIFDAHWADGCWMGRYKESGYPGSLVEFVAMRAEELRQR